MVKKISRKQQVEKRVKALVALWKKSSRQQRALSIGVVSAACIAVVVLGAFVMRWGAQSGTNATEQWSEETSISTAARHPLTGEILMAPLERLPQVFGVMVENSADAWPISGVDEAFLVIEAPVEGSIPRFIAFFSEEQDVRKIGPVRSSRPYYLDWNEELDGIYVHVGGSPSAMALIAARDVLDLDQFYQSEYFYRDELTRYAPHNVYTTTNDLRRAIAEVNEIFDHAQAEYDSWIFTDGIVSENVTHAYIHLDWSNASGYDVDWVFNATTNEYERDQGGVRYTASTIVVLETDVSNIAGDDKGRKKLRTLGVGSARVFQNGNEIVGTWKKPSAEERLRFYDENNEEITMNAGTTWIEVVDSLARLSSVAVQD